jgi:hypothetical protein
MPITTISWLMILSLIGTDIMINIFENRKSKKSNEQLEEDRRQFSYTHHIPERRSGYKVKKSDRRLEQDRRHFSYANHFPERRSGGDRRSDTDG